MNGRATVLSSVLGGKYVFELQQLVTAGKQTSKDPDQKWHHSSRDLKAHREGGYLFPSLSINRSEMQNG